MRYLHGVCGHLVLLPRSLAIPLCYDPTDNPLYWGGLADVWRGEYRGREVVAEVLKYRGDLGRLRRVGCWYF